jgi:5-methyltetrahydropteroyltriglutamate--homocysteine methyltransferase
VFSRIAADRLLLEYDDERSGGFDPLRLVPDGKIIVLVLVTTKTSEVEPAAQIAARLHQAQSVVGTDRLAVSPQCGFATSAEGNPVTPEAQWGKLTQLVKIARDILE